MFPFDRIQNLDTKNQSSWELSNIFQLKIKKDVFRAFLNSYKTIFALQTVIDSVSEVTRFSKWLILEVSHISKRPNFQNEFFTKWAIFWSCSISEMSNFRSEPYFAVTQFSKAVFFFEVTQFSKWVFFEVSHISKWPSFSNVSFSKWAVFRSDLIFKMTYFSKWPI